MKRDQVTFIKSIIVSVVLLLTIGIHFRPARFALERNNIAICLIKFPESDRVEQCKSQFRKLADYDMLGLGPTLAIGRFAGNLGNNHEVISLLSGIDRRHLDPLSAYYLALAYIQTSRPESAVTVAIQTGLPTSMLIQWAMEAFRNGKLTSARLWLHAIDARHPTDWSDQRWMGFLWLHVEGDSQRAIEYLEPAHMEMPDSIYTMLLLGMAYRDTNIDRSVEVLEQVYMMRPNDWIILRNLMTSLEERGTSADMDKWESLREQAIGILMIHLQEQPDDQSAYQWLRQLQHNDH